LRSILEQQFFGTVEVVTAPIKCTLKSFLGFSIITANDLQIQ